MYMGSLPNARAQGRIRRGGQWHTSKPEADELYNHFHADCATPALASCMSSPYAAHGFNGTQNH
jgi:hypothetical protein